MLIVITAEKNSIAEKKQLKIMLNEGLELVHVRKPSFSVEEIKTWLAYFQLEEQQKMIVYHHAKELTEVFPLKGIHLNEITRKNLRKNFDDDAKSLQQKKLSLSSSFHDIQEAQQQEVFDYTLLSPVFTSISKKNYFGKKHTISSTQKPIIALGGITPENISKIKKMGYQGVAVLGSIWLEDNPIRAFKKINKKYQHSYG